MGFMAGFVVRVWRFGVAQSELGSDMFASSRSDVVHSY